MARRTVAAPIAIVLIAVFGPALATAQVVPADSAYYDFWVGEWHRVVDGQVAPEPRFVVEEGIFPGALEERWQMEGYRAKAWRGWDAARKAWTFVWVSERGHFQVWDERKIGEHWYMYRTFVIDGEEVLSRQAFIPQPDGSVTRTSEHSRDGGETWTLRFEETYLKVPRQDDDARIFLNGEQVHAYTGFRDAWAEQDTVPVTLRAGASELLVKVCNRDSNWRFNLRITDEAGRSLVTERTRGEVRLSPGGVDG